MGKVPDIMWLEETRKDDIGSVGGKGASLGEMASIGLPVPKAFTVTAQAFRRFLKETKIEQKLFKNLKDIDVENTDDLERSAQACRELIRNAKMPADIKKEISSAYSKLGKNTIVAVRSSATAEDLPTASFAGQQETFLNVRGEPELLQSVQLCWASLYTERAVYYRVKQGFAHEKVDIAVVVQKLVKSEKAGVLFSSHPVTGEPTTIIEASWGLGEAVVSGAVSPDNYVYDRRSGRVVDRKIANKKMEIVPDGDQGTREVEVDAERQNAPVLSDEEVADLAKYGEISEKHYNVPQDMEWGIVGDTIYILQSRPITTIKRHEGKKEEEKKAGEKGKEQRVLLEGQGASPGIGSGKVVIVKSVKDTGRVKEGDILVAKMTNPDMVPAMRRVAAIITDEGGMTCHAAIVSRELGTPAVVGTKNATSLLKTDQMVTVDGEKGLVYEGKVRSEEAAAEKGAIAAPSSPLITATAIKVNVSLPEAAKRAAATGADGVGLLRIEHLILALNKTPGWFIKHDREKEFIDELANGIQVVLDAFPGKPVWVRTLDAPTDEFRNMEGGEDEPAEHNPMLGWRGIRRDLATPEQFRLQIEAFKRLWDKGYSNLGLMFPMISHPSEFSKAREMLKGWGVEVDEVPLGIMIEVPSAAIMVEDFIRAGISFASFGTNDLIQYTLAIDRNNQNVADMYYPKHPAVLRLIDDAIAVCRKHGVECSICGQAGSDPDMVQWLIEHGIASVSANIDAVQKIRERAYRTEQRMLLDFARKNNA